MKFIAPLVLLSLLSACSTQKAETLVLVTVSTESDVPDVDSLILRVATVERVFRLDKGLARLGVKYGVYIPASATGDVMVAATAKGANPCAFVGQGLAKIPAAGSVVEVMVAVQRKDGCDVARRDGGPGGTPPIQNEKGSDGGLVAVAIDGGAPPIPGVDAGGNRDMAMGPPVPAIDARAVDLRVDLPPMRPIVDMSTPVDLPPGPLGPPNLMACKTCFTYATASTCDAGKNVNNFPARGLAFSPDGSLLAVAAWANSTRLWSVGPGGLSATTRELRSSRLEDLFFSSDGKRLFGADFTDIFRVFDLATDTEATSFDTRLESLETSLGFLPMADPDRIVTTTRRGTSFRIWSLSRGAVVQNFSTPAPENISGARPAGGSQWVLVSEYGDAPFKFHLLDVAGAAPKVVGTFMHPTLTKAIIAPDGKVAALGGSGGLRLVDLSDKTKPMVLGTPVASSAATDSFEPLRFSPDQKWLLVQFVSTNLAELRLYDVAASRLVSSLVLTYGVFASAFSPDSRAVAVTELQCGMFRYCH